MAGFTTTLLTCLAQHLEDTGVANWHPEGVYATTDPKPAIYLKAIPGTNSPDRAYALTYYDVDSDAGLSNDIAGIQVRARGTKDPRVVDDLADAVFDVLHGAEQLRLGPEALPVVKVWRVSHTSIGQDANSRWETTSNFYLHVARTTPHRPD